MKNIPIPGSRALEKPDHVPDDQHEPLHVVLVRDDEDHVAGFILAFQPNKEDLEAISAGRPILLKVPGPILTNVDMFTLDDKGNPNS